MSTNRKERAERFALRARLVFPVASPPLDGGVITIEGDRIVAVGENLSAKPPCDCGHVAIVPGLVNPHTHLELSDYAAPLGAAGMRLPRWIHDLVTGRRREVMTSGDNGPDRHCAAIATGLLASRRGGVTTVGDIATWDLPDRATRLQSLLSPFLFPSAYPRPTGAMQLRELFLSRLGRTARRSIRSAYPSFASCWG